MHNDLFHGTLNAITWKVPAAKCIVDGVGMDGVLREGSWEGPGDPPTAATIEGWKAEFVADDIGNDLDAESKINEEALAGMYAVFEVTTGSPPTDAEKVTLRNSMKANLLHEEA
jgi:hypothetical protein